MRIASLPSGQGLTGKSRHTGRRCSGLVFASLLFILPLEAAPVPYPEAPISGRFIDSNGAPATGWRVIPEDAEYPTDDIVVAFCEVTDPAYNLPVDRVNTDCTEAFQAALDDASLTGGGTVFIPEGEYRIDGTLTIEDNVTLRGRWREITVDTPAAGTILSLYATNGASSVLLAGTGSGVRDLTFWHPGQDADHINTNSPFVIKGTSGQVTIQNITLLNAYNGIDMSTSSMCCLQDIFGSPLKLGLTADKSYAVSRYTGIHFSPDYWAWSGLPGAPATNGAHKTFMRDSGTGINIKEMDGFYLLFSTISGYAKGLLFQDGASGDNPWGTIAYTDVTDCTIAVHIESAKRIDMMKCTFQGSENAILTHVGAALNTCTIAADDKAIKSLGQSATLINCTRSGGVDLNGGTLIEESYTNSIPEFNAVYDRVRKPLRTELFNISNYGAVGDGRYDDTSAIQAAIAAAHTNGGGIVFIPNGQYVVKTNLELAPGVELRGSSGGRHIASGKSGQELGSVILIDDVGKGDTNAPPFLALDDYCGVRGIAFHYVNQDFRAFIPYPFMVQANGMKNYIIDCFASNPYQAAELNGDDHLVEYTFFGGLRRTYRANNCSGGRIQNCHIKPDFWRDYWVGNNNPKSDLGELKWNVGKELEVFYLNGCTNYSISSIFNHASHAFFTADNSSGQTLCVGGEQLQSGYIFKNGSENFDLIKASCNINNIGDYSGTYGIRTMEGFSGQARFFGVGVQGAARNGYAAEGGLLYLQGGGLSGPSDRGALNMTCGPSGTLIADLFSSSRFIGFDKQGTVTFNDSSFSRGFVNDYTAEYRTTGNQIDKTYILADLNADPLISYGMALDTSNIEIVDALMFGSAAAESSSDARRVQTARLVSGSYSLDIIDPHFTDGSNQKVDFESYWYADTDCTINIYYHDVSGAMKLGQTFTLNNSSNTIWKTVKFSVSDARFGSSEDIRIDVVGDSPGLGYFAVTSDNVPTGNYSYPPTAPNGLEAIMQDSLVTLDWADNTEYSVAGYNVYRKTPTGSYGAPLASVTSSDYVDNTALSGVTYYYVVTALDTHGNESVQENGVVASDGNMITNTLHPEADAYVRAGNYANNNYGSEVALQIKTSSDNFTRQAYLRFDLSAFPSAITRATLRLKLDAGSGSDIHSASFVGDDSWGESTITWNNKPAGAAILGSAAIPGSGEWLELDVTSQVANEWEGDQVFSVVLASDSGGHIHYHSREAVSVADHPELVIETAGAPDAYTIWAEEFGGVEIIGVATNDYDNDGLINFGEYALGGNPTNAAEVGVGPTWLLEGGALVCIHPQRPDPNLVYTLETRTNLVSGTWTNAGYAVIGTNVTGSSWDYVTNSVPVSHDRNFIRLKVNQ